MIDEREGNRLIMLLVGVIVVYITIDSYMGTVDSYLYSLGDFSEIDLDHVEFDPRGYVNEEPCEVSYSFCLSC